VVQARRPEHLLPACPCCDLRAFSPQNRLAFSRLAMPQSSATERKTGGQLVRFCLLQHLEQHGDKGG